MSERHPSDAILGTSATIADLRAQIRRLAAFDSVGNPHVPTVLLQGETGTGKGLVARVLHDSGARASNPFIDVNCAAIPDTMLEAELFGFEAGSFTDARRAKPGLFEAASTGTLFLDEIDSLSLALQAKLLKAIEEKRVRRLGAVDARRFDVKLVVATQAELEPLVASGRFRADLYHRLAVLVLQLPPLRDRADDAVLLAERFAAELAGAHALPTRALTVDARRWLREHPWPGNVRELSHLIERVTLLAPDGDLDAEALRRGSAPLATVGAGASLRASAAAPGGDDEGDGDARGLSGDPSSHASKRDVAGAGGAPSAPPEESGVQPPDASTITDESDDATSDPAARAEAARIRDALLRSGGNVVNAARLLGLGRNALRYRMRRLGIEKPSLDELARPASRTPDAARSTARGAAVAMHATPAAAVPTGTITTPDEPGGWEQKRAATLAIDVYFPPLDDSSPRYEPWTAIARWRQAIGDKLRGFGAVLLDETSSRISAAFGIPRALEQTPQRAVQAALAIQHLTASATPPAPELRIAVHLGDVRFDAAAPALRALAIGDTLALPERLLGHAGAGEILLSGRLARQVEASCLLEARALRLGPRAEDAITAYAMVAPRQRPVSGARRDLGSSVFVGRERELATLDDAFRSADASSGQIVFVSGEAGLGKSRLLGELRERLAGRPHVWLEGRCAPYGASTPLLPVIDGLRRFFAIDDHDDDAAVRDKIAAGVAGFGPNDAWVVPFIEQTLSVAPAAAPDDDAGEGGVAALDSASRRSETFRALRALLLRAAEQQCVVLLIEDLHWIDRTSEEYLTFVADVIPTQRVLMVCTHRPGYAHPFGDRSYHGRLTLRALSEDDMAAMTRGLLGTSDMPAELRALVARKAEGNPFFVEEVTHSLLEDGALLSENGHVVLTRSLADIAIPDTIQDVLTARIDRLADDARQAIQVASVIGREFALRLLERISEVGEGVRTQLDELRSVELIYQKALHPELAYMFKHALTHDVAYQSVLAERRRQLHRTIGLAIEELYADRLEEHYETLAHHFARGDDLPRALLYHDRAAEKAADRHATEAVIDHCRRALAIADRPGAAASDEVRCRLEARLGLSSFYSSDYAGSAAAFERAAAAAPPEAAPTLLALAAQSHFWGHAYDRSDTDVAAVLRPEAQASPGARAMALNVRSFRAVVLEADFHAARPDIDEASRLAAGVADVEATVRFNRTLFAEWTGNYREAIALAEQVMAAGKELRLAHLVVWPYWFLGKARCCLGDYGGAIAQLEQGYEICDRIGDRAWKSRLLNTLGWCFGELGAHERARDMNRRAAHVARALGDPEIVSNSEINLSLDALALGSIDDARGFLEPIEDELSRGGDPWMRWRYALHTLEARAQIERARGAPDAMLVAATRELEGARHYQAPKIEARALVTSGRALLELERWDEARASLEAALQVAERIQTPRAAWRAHALLVTLHQRRGRRDLALRHEQLHRTLVDAAGRTIDDAELRRGLHAAATR